MGLLVNRAKASTATTGTGAATPGSGVSPFRSWSGAGATSGYWYDYLIEDGSAWEMGVGYYNGTTITRPGPGVDPWFESSTSALLNLSGSATIACVANKDTISAGTPFMPPLASDFTLFSGDGSAATLTNNRKTGLTVSTANLATSGVLRGGYKSLPAVGTDWSVIARIRYTSALVNYLAGGIIAYESSTSKAIGVLLFADTSSVCQIRRQTLGGSYSSDDKFQPWSFDQWIKFARTGTTLTVSRSSDGENWGTVYSAAQNNYLTTAPDRIGPGIFQASSSYPAILNVPYWWQSF